MGTHVYKLKDGTRVPGVTTVIGNCKLGSIEGLLIWANREGKEGRDHRDTRQAAADAGTCAHAMVEAFIRKHEFKSADYEKEVLDKALPAFKAFQEWCQQTTMTPAYPETSLVSEQYKYGGTMDTILVKGALSLGDWKTSRSVHVDYLPQLAAYGQLWNENHPDNPITGGYHLLRFGKPENPDDPVTFEHRYWEHLEPAWETFKRQRELYDLYKRLKGLV